MGFSYSGDPRKSDKDQVRFLIRDTKKDNFNLNDEEIQFLLELEGSPLKAAWKAAESIAAFFAGKCDETVGRVSVKFSQKFTQYTEMARALKRSAAIKLATPFSGALTHTQKEVQELDNDRVQPTFTRTLHDQFRHDDRTDHSCRVTNKQVP